MRSAMGITWILVLTACATTSRPEDRPASEAAKRAQAQLDDLQALEGNWWGTGGQGTDRNPVEFRYRVTEGGKVVEETCFPDTPEERVTRYRVDGERLVGTRTSASGAPVELVAWPGDEIWQVSYTMQGTSLTGQWDDTVWTDSSGGKWKKAVNRHGLVFSLMERAQIELTDVRSRSTYDLMIMENREIVATWRSSGSDGHGEALKSYHLTRKLPGSVERTANRESPEQPTGQPKKSWLDERSNWDLRGVP